VTETPAGDRDPAIDPQLERLLDAPTSPVAAPWNALAEVLMAASAPAGDGPVPGEARALAAFRELVSPVGVARGASWWRRRHAAGARIRAWKLAVAGLGGVVAFSGGAVALAATGSLPGGAQGVAHDVLSTLGVHVPGPNSHAGTHPDQRGHSGKAKPNPVPSAHPSPHATPSDHPTHPSHPAHPSGQPSTPGANGTNGGNQGQHNGVGQGGTPTPHSSNAGGQGKSHADTHPSPRVTPSEHGQSQH
jgi:hypothetical protein